MVSIDPEGAELRALDSLIDLTNKSIVEIGAGDGRLTWRLARRARSVLAIDPSESDVGRAQAALSPDLRRRVSFEVADATVYDFPRASFDVAVLSYSL